MSSISKVGVSFILGAAIAPTFKNNLKAAKNSVSLVAQEINLLGKKKAGIETFQKLSAEGKTATKQFGDTSKSLEKLNVNFNNLAGELNMISRKLPILNKMKDNMKAVEESFKAAKSSFASAGKIFAGLSATAVAVTLPAIDVKKAEGELATLYTNSKGLTDENAIALISQSAKKYAAEYAGVTVPEFIRASYDIKSGIASLSADGVATFTTMSALTAKATKASVGDMTSLFALGYGVYGSMFKNETEFATAFSNAVSGATQIFKTDGKDLAEAIGQLGNNATSAGVGLSEQLSVIGVLKTVTKSGSVAATQYNAFLRGAADSVKMDTILGVSLTDAKGKLLPLADMLDKIKQQFKGKLETGEFKNAMQKAFGDEGAKAVLNLINKTDDLRTSQVQLNEVINEGTLTKAMADAASRGDSLDLLKNKIKLIATELSTTLIPLTERLFIWVNKNSSGITTWIQRNDSFIRIAAISVASITALGGVLSIVIGILRSFATIFSIVKVAINATQFAFTVLTGSIKLAKVAMVAFNIVTTVMTNVLKVVRVAFIAFNFVLATNPIILFVGAVATLITIGILLYKNWDTVKEKLASVWAWIKEAFAGVGEWLSGIWNGIKSAFSNGVDFVSKLFWEAIDIWLLPFKLLTVAINKVKKALGMEFDGEASFMAEIKKTYTFDAGQGIAGSSPLTQNIVKQSASQKLISAANSNKPANSNANTNNVTYSPVINIQGNADKATVEQAVKNGNDDFSKRYFATSPRLDYAQ